MGASYGPVIFFTVFWSIIFIIVPLFVPKGRNNSVNRCILKLTASVCWLFWLLCYMTQMNPLIGPILDQNTILIISREWGNPLKDLKAE